jgi:hypothetical protein
MAAFQLRRIALASLDLARRSPSFSDNVFYTSDFKFRHKINQREMPPGTLAFERL